MQTNVYLLTYLPTYYTCLNVICIQDCVLIIVAVRCTRYVKRSATCRRGLVDVEQVPVRRRPVLQVDMSFRGRGGRRPRSEAVPPPGRGVVGRCE